MARPTRRLFVTGLASALGLGGVASTSGHPGEDHPSFSGDHNIHRHDFTENAELVGFHTLGDVGSESTSGHPDNPLYGMITDTWVDGDIAFVAIQSSSEPTGNRGVAVVDVSGYTRAECRADLEKAEMTVLSFIGNETEAGTTNTARASPDGKFVACSKQAIGALYGEEASTSTDTRAAPGPSPKGAEVYEMSDPGNPQYVGAASGPNAGFHNCFVHRIGGEYYLFGVQGVGAGSSGVHIFRIEEDVGVIPVNYWGGDDLPLVSWGTESLGRNAGGYYCHDFYAYDDPKTGTPLGFVAYWNNGAIVLDLSDPTDITALGRGEMPVTHYVQPAPALIDGKRVMVGGQEHSSRSAEASGLIRIWDADGVVEDDEFTECEELATWTLYDSVTYGDYDLTPHNLDVTEDGWITQSHQHAGVRFLKIQPPGEGEVATDEWHIAGRRVRALDEDRPITHERNEDGEWVQEFETDEDGVFTSGYENARLEEEAQAYFRSHVEVPVESKTESVRSPDFWSARRMNGVTFGASQHSGLYAIAADPLEVGTREVRQVDVSRSADETGLATGGTHRITYRIETDGPVRLRDRIPADWTVVGGAAAIDADAVTVTDVGAAGKRVEFDDPVDGNESRSIVVQVDGAPGTATLGPVQYSTKEDPSHGGADWTSVVNSPPPRPPVGHCPPGRGEGPPSR